MVDRVLSAIPDFNDQSYYFNNGIHESLYEFLGAHPVAEDDSKGFRFVVWAPRAKSVALQGDFNDWRLEAMTALPNGLWGIVSSDARVGQFYKFMITDQVGHQTSKIDPFAHQFEVPPKDASVLTILDPFSWTDQRWLSKVKRTDYTKKPLNIYEVHFSSWRTHPDGRYYSFKELADSLIPYVKELGYTHIEFMPLMEHPLIASWGYQITGYYAVAGRFGTVNDLREFVDQAHQAGIGVLMDWVPGHFCRNEVGLAYYDGTPTFEYEDVRRADNVGWGSLNFDLGKPQVRSFLLSNALFWLKECHIDGLRTDAVSFMIYRDHGSFRENWVPAEDGSNKNYEGISFLQHLNQVVAKKFPQVLMIAEEATDWEGVTAKPQGLGLGFDFKWNMGWMNDLMRFIELPNEQRSSSYRLLTFPLMYAFNEKYILAISHDEVVHGKDSMLGKIKGDRYNQFAMLRAFYAYRLAFPGKKLHFMGEEIGQFLEWREYSELEWDVLERPFNKEFQQFVKTVNTLYQTEKALYERDLDQTGLTVLEADDAQAVILSFMRQGEKPRDFLIIATNFLPQEHRPYRIGVPYRGTYEILLNSEMTEFGGTWTKEEGPFQTFEAVTNGQPYAIDVILPALSTIYIRPKRVYGVLKN